MAGVAEATRQIFAYSGVLYPQPGGKDTFDLAEYALSLAGRSQGIRVCYLATAIGDLPVAINSAVAANTGLMTGLSM